MRRHGGDGGGECPTPRRVNRGFRRRLEDRRVRDDRVRDDGVTLPAGSRDQAEGQDGQQALRFGLRSASEGMNHGKTSEHEIAGDVSGGHLHALDVLHSAHGDGQAERGDAHLVSELEQRRGMLIALGVPFEQLVEDERPDTDLPMQAFPLSGRVASHRRRGGTPSRAYGVRPLSCSDTSKRNLGRRLSCTSESDSASPSSSPFSCT
jgi:hypothetical protein